MNSRLFVGLFRVGLWLLDSDHDNRVYIGLDCCREDNLEYVNDRGNNDGVVDHSSCLRNKFGCGEGWRDRRDRSCPWRCRCRVGCRLCRKNIVGSTHRCIVNMWRRYH